MEKYDIEFIIQALNEAGWKPIRSIEPWVIIPVETARESDYLSLCIYENEKILFEGVQKVKEDDKIQSGDVVALIPPVSGG